MSVHDAGDGRPGECFHLAGAEHAGREWFEARHTRQSATGAKAHDGGLARGVFQVEKPVPEEGLVPGIADLGQRGNEVGPFEAGQVEAETDSESDLEQYGTATRGLGERWSEVDECGVVIAGRETSAPARSRTVW